MKIQNHLSFYNGVTIEDGGLDFFFVFNNFEINNS